MSVRYCIIHSFLWDSFIFLFAFNLRFQWRYILSIRVVIVVIMFRLITNFADGVRVAHLFSFLCCVFVFCLSSSFVMFTQCYQRLWIFHSWLPLRLSLTFTQDRQHNGQKKKVQTNKQRSTKHYAQNQRSRNTNHTKNLGWTHVLRKGKQFLLH
jgi:hypothetical protein